MALAPCRKLLLQLLCTLAQDDWAAVSQPCQCWLASTRSASSRAGEGLAEAAREMAGETAQSLLGACRQGEEAGIVHARRLLTALQVRRCTGWLRMHSSACMGARHVWPG